MDRGIKKFIKIRNMVFVVTKINTSVICTLIRGDFYNKVKFEDEETAMEVFESIGEEIMSIMYMSHIFTKNIKDMNSRTRG